MEELPEQYRYYTLEVRSDERAVYSITGATKQNIVKSPSQFIELPSGEVINRAYIVSITLDGAKTRDTLKSLPEETIQQIKKGALSTYGK